MALTKNSQIDLNGNEMILDADGDTTITADTDDQIDIKTAGTDRVQINSTGDFLVRQTSADVYDTNSGGSVRQYWGNQFSAQNNTNSRVIIGSASNSGLVGGATVNSGGTKPIVNSYMAFTSVDQTAGGEDGIIAFYTSSGGGAGTEKMRITSVGKILMNHTSSISDETLQVRTNQSIGYGILVDETHSGGGTFMRFRVNGSIVGQIYGNGSATTYATSSDATLKDVTGKARGLEVINELNPVSFTWKKTGVSDEGFIAQEVDKIIPSVVHKDAEDMYSMDYGKVTPYLVKAIQEQQEQIEALQSEINTLKGE